MSRQTTLWFIYVFFVTGCNAGRDSASKRPSQVADCADAFVGHDALARQLQTHQALLHKTTSADALTLTGNDWVRIARVHSEPQYYAQASACARAALAQAPTDPGAQNLQAFVLLNEHRFDEAKLLANQVLSRDSDNPVAWGTLSDAQLELGDLNAALDAAQHMLDVKPNLPSYGRAAHLRWLQGDSRGAKQVYAQAIHAGEAQKDPEPMAWMIVQAAWIFWHEGDYRGALAGFDAALRRVPKYAPALEGKGRALLAQGDYATAVSSLKQAFALHPLIETAWWLGDAYTLCGQRDKAQTYYAHVEREGQRLDPRTLALFYATQDREPTLAVTLARQEYAQRHDIYSKDVLGFALYRAGQFSDAKHLLDDALRSGIQDARLLFHAGLIHSASGDGPAGPALLARARQLNPHFDRLLMERTDATLANNR